VGCQRFVLVKQREVTYSSCGKILQHIQNEPAILCCFEDAPCCLVSFLGLLWAWLVAQDYVRSGVWVVVGVVGVVGSWWSCSRLRSLWGLSSFWDWSRTCESVTLDLHRIIETCTKVEIKDVYYSQSAFLTAFNFYRRLLSNINYAIKLIAVSLSAVVSSSHANYQTTKSIFHKKHTAKLPKYYFMSYREPCFIVLHIPQSHLPPIHLSYITRETQLSLLPPIDRSSRTRVAVLMTTSLTFLWPRGSSQVESVCDTALYVWFSEHEFIIECRPDLPPGC